MSLIRTIALGLMLGAAAAAVAAAVMQLWSYTSSSPTLVNAQGPDLDERSQLLRDRVETLARRVRDMELLVLVLLGTSGLYAIVFVASSYLSAKSFARQADRTIAHLKDEIGIAMGDLRELQEQTQRKLAEMPPPHAAANPVLFPRANRPLTHDDIERAGWESQLVGMAQRTAQWKRGNLGDQERLELLRYESEAAYMEVAGAKQVASAVAALYRNFAEIYAPHDPTRARFYLDRALVLAFPEPQLASEIRYDLACWFAAAHDFAQAMRELAAAFRHHSRALDARLTIDLEEGGKLFEMAPTPPFNEGLNNLLLNVSIP